MKASPVKLQSGKWGARVTGSVKAGDVVTIVTRAGKRWDAKVERVVWTGDGCSICATLSMDRQTATRSTRRSINNTCDYCEDGTSFGLLAGSRCRHCGGQVS